MGVVDTWVNPLVLKKSTRATGQSDKVRLGYFVTNNNV